MHCSAPTTSHPRVRSTQSTADLSVASRRGRALRGFSMIELLVVLVVMGVLVGLAIPRYREYKRRFYLTTMVTDLRNLASTEEAYWNIAGTYSTDLRLIQYSSSPRVSISMVSADTLGWAAKASYAGDSAMCAIYYGNAPVLAPATLKNVIGCTQ
ncbi:MAG TPA: prepilin-type N-terminal cleavage/methylation domain-containing protein [Gemmatimonadaceae bacterium]